MASFSRSLFASRARKAILLSALIAITLGTAAYAYVASLAPRIGPRATITSTPLEFTIELDKAEYKQGENFTARLSLKNISNKTITVSWGSLFIGELANSPFDISVVDISGTVVFQWSRIYVFLNYPLKATLEPGEQLRGFHIWDGRTDPQGQDPQFAYAAGFVPRGDYYIKGLTRRFHLTADDQTDIITLETPTITIAIT